MEDKNIYYMSIGYPIGLCMNTDGDKFFNVEVGGNLVGLYNDSYLLWKYCFFDVKTKEDIVEFFYKNYKISDFNAKMEIHRLISENVLLEIDTSSMDKVFDTIKNLYPIRNGFGTGLTKDIITFRIINQGQNFDISPEDFNIWKESNNRNTIKDIYEKVRKELMLTEKEAKSVVVNGILRLKTIDLIRVSL